MVVHITCLNLNMFTLEFTLLKTKITTIVLAEWPTQGRTDDGVFDAHDLDDDDPEPDPNVPGASQL
jgi:hypothetical protein